MQRKLLFIILSLEASIQTKIGSHEFLVIYMLWVDRKSSLSIGNRRPLTKVEMSFYHTMVLEPSPMDRLPISSSISNPQVRMINEKIHMYV